MRRLTPRMIRHEWRGLMADRTAWIVLGLFSLLLGYAVANGVVWTRFQWQVLAFAGAEARDRLDGLRASMDSLPVDAPPPGPFGRDPRSPASVGGRDGAQYAFLPPEPLAPTAIGQSDLLPYYVQVTMRSRYSFASTNEIENPSNLLEGRFDLAFVLVALFPLLILALSYNLLSIEREQGTLALLAAQPVSLERHLVVKVLVRGTFIVAIAVALAIVGLLAGGLDLGAPGVAGRWMLWTTVVVSYALFWFTLALVVNLGRWGSPTNAMILAAVWLALVIILPGILNVVVRTVHPVPSRVQLISAMRTASNDASARGSELLARLYGDHPELAPAGAVSGGEFMARTYAVQDEVDRQVAPLLTRFEEQLDRQQGMAERYRLLSPAVTAYWALADIAGTGSARYRHWQHQVVGFHERWQRFFIPRAFRRQWLTTADYASIPEYQYQPEAHGEVEARVRAGLLGLLLPTIGLLLVGAVRIRRVEVFR